MAKRSAYAPFTCFMWFSKSASTPSKCQSAAVWGSKKPRDIQAQRMVFPFDMEEILVKANASASRLVATGQLMAGRAPPGAMSNSLT